MKKNILLLGIGLLLGNSIIQAQTWNQIPSGTDKKLNTIDFPTPSIGYIGGNDSLLLKTVDGGLNWTELTYTGVTFYPDGDHIINLKFITENVGYMAVGPYSGSYKTTDGGLTWVSLTDLVTCFNQGLYFFDENNGFVGGSGCFQGEIMNRLSSGIWSEATVNAPTLDAMNYVVDIDFLDANYGLAASRSGYVLRTIDAGLNWDTIPGSVVMNPLTSILIVNANLAYAGYVSVNTGYGLYISTDGGLSWQEDMSSATFLYPDFHTLHQSGNGKTYTGGTSESLSDGVIFENPGEFSEWGFSGVTHTVYDISSYSDSIVFAVGDSGQIVVNKDLSLLGIATQEINPMAFNIFPNPVTSELNFSNIKGFIDEEAHITIFTMTGELVHSEKFTTKINLEKLKSGIYLVKVETENGAITKKIIKE